MEFNKKYYNNFFRKFGSGVHDDPVRFTKIAGLCKGKVLDIGCGTGTLADFYSGSYIGFDISDIAQNMAKELRRKSATFFNGDFTKNLDYFSDNFDTIVMAEFLEHIKDDKVVFDNIKKVAKPDTRLIISVPNGDRVPDESHLRTFTIPELRKRFRQLGKVKFYNWQGASHRILMTCDFGQKNEDLISLVMPVKNESKGLETAVLSCIDFVDNIVIAVDNSSKDNTLEVAKRYADVLKTFDWQNSFARARNFAQENVKTKWVLALDGHEYVDYFFNPEDFSLENIDGLETNIILENGFEFHFPRIVRNYVTWAADVHNFPTIKSRRFLPKFIIHHDRENLQAKESADERSRQRSKMVIEVMDRERKKNPKNARPYFYIAQQYFIQQSFWKAIKNYKKYLKYSKHKGERWLAYYEIAYAHAFLGHYIRALWATNDANKEIPGRWEIAKSRGSIFAMADKQEQAIRNYVESFNIQTGKFSYYPEKRDDAQTWDFIANCYYKLKMLREAMISWDRFLELEKKKPEAEQNKDQIKIIKKLMKY